MNVDNVASRLSETDAAKFKAADHAWKLACERVGEIREQELRDHVRVWKWRRSGGIGEVIGALEMAWNFGGRITVKEKLADHLEQFGFHVRVVEPGVFNVWDDATCQSFQLTGV